MPFGCRGVQSFVRSLARSCVHAFVVRLQFVRACAVVMPDNALPVVGLHARVVVLVDVFFNPSCQAYIRTCLCGTPCLPPLLELGPGNQ